MTYRLNGRKWQRDANSEVKFFLNAEATNFKVVSKSGPPSDGPPPDSFDDGAPGGRRRRDPVLEHLRAAGNGESTRTRPQPLARKPAIALLSSASMGKLCAMVTRLNCASVVAFVEFTLHTKVWLLVELICLLDVRSKSVEMRHCEANSRRGFVAATWHIVLRHTPSTGGRHDQPTAIGPAIARN